MKATIENLKANREEIIKRLTSLFGVENLKSSMNILKDRVEYAEMFEKTATIDSVIENMISNNPFETSRRRTSKTAEMLAEMAEKRGETWDSKKGKYVKF